MVGESARKLFADARKMLDRIVREKWLTAKGVVAFWPCRRDGDDVVLFEDETRSKEISRLYFLRQQIEKRAPRANMCLADFISPKADWIGGFAVTAGHGIEQHLARFKADHDDYSDILLKALADRLAEAFAERLHERVRKTIWGYAPDEALTNEELVREKYRGIRPAPGYPACPDHSQKPELFRLLNAGQNAGITPDRELRDDADLGGVGLLLRPSARPSISAWRASAATRSRTTPSAAAADRAGREVAAAEHRLLSSVLTYALVLVVGYVAGTVSGIVGTGATIILLPVLVFAFGPREAVPIMAIVALMSNFAKITSWWKRDRLAGLRRLCAGRHPGGGAGRAHPADPAASRWSTSRSACSSSSWCPAAAGSPRGTSRSACGTWCRRRRRHRLPDRHRRLDRPAQRAGLRRLRSGQGRLHRHRGGGLARALHQQGADLPPVRRAADRHRGQGPDLRLVGDGRHLYSRG